MQNHAKKFHGTKDQPVHQCIHCNIKYLSENDFSKHLQKHEKEAEKKRKIASSASINEQKMKLILKVFNMTCTLCPTEFTSFVHVKQHYKTEHNQAGFLVCCNRKFMRLHRVVDHCASHCNALKQP